MAFTVVIQPESEPEPGNADNQSETDEDYVGFLDMDFMTWTVVPLNIIYLDTFSKGEIPHSTYSDVESDDDQLITRKRKASSPGGTNDVEAGSLSAPPPNKKRKMTVNLDELAEVWDF